MAGFDGQLDLLPLGDLESLRKRERCRKRAARLRLVHLNIHVLHIHRGFG